MEQAVDFEKMAENLATARMMLKERVLALEAEIAALKKKHLPEIRKWADNAAQKQMELYEAIGDHPERFVKPRTMILHGIKFGYMKGKGEIFWENDARVVALIRKHFPEQADALIKITETPIKSVLAKMPAADLKKIGVTLDGASDEIIIKFTDSEIDKIVNAVLKEGQEPLGTT